MNHFSEVQDMTCCDFTDLIQLNQTNWNLSGFHTGHVPIRVWLFPVFPWQCWSDFRLTWFYWIPVHFSSSTRICLCKHNSSYFLLFLFWCCYAQPLLFSSSRRCLTAFSCHSWLWKLLMLMSKSAKTHVQVTSSWTGEDPSTSCVHIHRNRSTDSVQVNSHKILQKVSGSVLWGALWSTCEPWSVSD